MNCPRAQWITEVEREMHAMDKPSEKNLSKMRTYAEKFAEKSGTYLHPDRRNGCGGRGAGATHRRSGQAALSL